MKVGLSLVLALSLVGTGVACRSTGGLSAAVKHGERLGADTLQTTLAVENNGFLDVDVYAITEGGARYRLGTATGHTTTTLPISQAIVPNITSLRFLADPIGGGRSLRTELITVAPGDEVTLVLPIS